MASSDPVLLRKIVDILWEMKPKRVLDVGFGFGKVGFLTREYLDVYFHRNYHKREWTTVVDGIEIWPDFITDVHRHLYDHIHIGDAVDVLPGLGHYDVIFMMDVIEHIPKEMGKRLLEIARKHARKVVVSTPSFHMEQGEILGNPHERHVSFWTEDELGGRCEKAGPLLISIGDGEEPKDFHIVCEGEPGWAVRHLGLDIMGFLKENGLKVHPPHDWRSERDISLVKRIVEEDLSARLYVSTGPAAEFIHENWGVPREQMFWVLHSVDDLLDFHKRYRGEPPPTQEERMRFLRDVPGDESMREAIGRYAGIGYLSKEQERILNAIGVDDAFHTPQYVDTELFKPRNRVSEGPLRVGAALATTAHPARKGVPLLSKIVGMIRGRDDMVFDPRAIRGPMNSFGLPFDQMPSYFDEVDVLVCTAFSEGGPLPPLQAGACEVPTISTRCGHMPEFVIDGETGFLVDADPDEFMRILSSLSEDRGMLQRIGSASRQHVIDHWSIVVNCPKWLRMIQEIR